MEGTRLNQYMNWDSSNIWAGEIFFVDDVPPKVSISEAIEIAKQYSTEESPGFINGVLDNIYKSIPNEVNTTKV